jgi:hypothetical protein
MGLNSDSEANRRGGGTGPEDLMHENEVYEKYPNLFADRELREARQQGLIGWYDTRKGPQYTKAQLMGYLHTKERAPCRNEKLNEARESPRASSKSATTGSSTKRTATITPIAGMTPALEKSAAELLER